MRFNVVISYLIVGVVVSFSCSPKLSTLNSNSKELNKVYYPPEPDTARIQFLTSFGSSDKIRKTSKFEEAMTGKINPVVISKPYGISSGNGKIYVSDIGNSALEIVDFQNASFELFVPNKKYKSLVNSAVDDNGDLYLLDLSDKKVFVYDNNKRYVSEFEFPEAIYPVDIDIKNNKIWITDLKNNRINVFNKEDHSFIDYFPKEEFARGNDEFLYQPLSIAVTDEYVYVMDMGAYKIKIFTHNGEFVKSIGSFGKASGQFTRPKGIAVDNDGLIYAVDAAFQNVQIFNTEGQLLTFFGQPLEHAPSLNLPASISIDYDNIDFFKKDIDPKFELLYLIYVTNQFGDNKVMVYGRIELK